MAYEQNVDDKIVNTEPTPLDPSPKVVVVENEETGELAPSPKLEADVLVEGEQNKDAKIVGQAPIKFPVKPVREMTYTDLVNVIKAAAPEMTTEEIMAALVGKYVRIMDAPTSTQLTQEQKAQIINGVFTEGSITISGVAYKNLVFFPATEIDGQYYGMFISSVSTASIGVYFINNNNLLGLNASSSANISLRSIKEFNGKLIPSYPTDLTKDYVFQQESTSGNLAWTSDLKVNTIEQTEANYSFEPVPTLPAGLEMTETSFKAVKVVNGILWIILEAGFHNTTENSITGTPYFTVSNLPTEISSKIYRRDGTTINNAHTNLVGICTAPVVHQAAVAYLTINSEAANTLNIRLSNVTVDAGITNYVSFRVPLILI